MSARVTVHWPGITSTQVQGQPGFFNDENAWASWLADAGSPAGRACREELAELDLSAVLTCMTDALPQDRIDWVSPSRLALAASRLAELITRADPRVDETVRLYAQNANGIEEPCVEFARDLHDVAAVARYAEEQGATAMTLDVDW